jgi:hypothetical protein
MANTAGQVLIPSQVASTQITPAVASSSVFLRATPSASGSTVWIGPNGVTPETGFPLKPGEILGPISGISVIHGVVGEGQSPVEVCFFQTG